MSKKRSTRTRSILIGLGVLVVVIAILIALLPMLASATAAPGIVKNLVEKQVNATADVENVTLRWSGPQSIEGLVLRDETGSQVADLDIHLKTNFLSLALSNISSYTVTISGVLHSTLYEDHTTSLKELLKSDKDRRRKDDAGSSKNTPTAPSLDGFVPVHVTIIDLEVHIDDQVRSEQMTVRIPTGELTAALGQPISASVTGTVTRGDATGNFTFGSSITNLLLADGSISPQGAAVQMKLSASNLPLPGVTQVDQVESASFVALTNDLAQQLEITADADLSLAADIPGGVAGNASPTAKSRLAINALLLAPLDENLQTDLGPQSITGSIDAQQIPADLVSLLLASITPDLPIDVTRDIGPSINLRVIAEPGQRRHLRLDFTADQATVKIAAVVEDSESVDRIATGPITISKLTADVIAHPDLVDAASQSQLVIDRATPINISAGDIFVPAADENGRRDFNRLAGNITLLVEQSFAIKRAEDEAPVHIAGIQLTAATKALGQETLLFGQILADGGSVLIDERLHNLVTNDGTLNRKWQQYQPTGTIRVQHLPASMITNALDDPPEQLLAYLDGAIDVAFETSTTEADELQIIADVQANTFNAHAQARQHDTGVTVESASLALTIEPELLRSAQSQSERPIAIDSPLPVTVALADAVTIPLDESGTYTVPTGPMFVSISTDQAIRLLNVPSLVEPLELREPAINLITSFDAGTLRSVDVAAAALWHTQSTNRTVGDLMFEASIPLDKTAEQSVSNVKVALERLAVRRMERALGRDVDSLAKWLGSRGNLYLTAQANIATRAIAGSFDAEFTQLAGTFEFDVTESQVLSLTGRTSELTIAAGAINEWLHMNANSDVSDAAIPAATVRSDVIGNVDVTTLQIPLAMLNSEPFDPALFIADVAVTAQSLELMDPQGVATMLSDLSFTLGSDGLQEPLGFALAGNVTGASAETSGAIAGSGRLTNLIDDQHRVNTENATLDMTLEGGLLPIAVADALGTYDGLLVAALGETAKADLKAEQFSTNSGVLFGTLTTDNGTMNVRLLGRNGFLRIRDQVPMQAQLELTPAFRDRVLQPIHPLFADIRSTEQPIRVTITSAKIPINGDVSQLDADIDMTVGAVEFTSGSAMLAILDLFRESTANVPGRIDPIKAKIRNGVVTYERFSAVIGKYTLNFLGQIDLNTKKVDLRFELPGKAVAQTFTELEGYVDGLVIPFRTRGVIGNVKTEIDPEYNLIEKAAEAGFKGAIEKELGGKIDDLLGDLLNPKKKQKTDPNTSEDKSNKK